MAALAGAIVVGGGVNTYADEPAPVNKEKEIENDYLDAAEKEYEKLNAVNDAEKEAEEEKPVVKDGYETYDEAVAAAKEVLKKDPINNAYKISLNQHGRFIYSLYIDNSDIPEASTEESNLFTNHEFAFRTKEEAEEAAKKALKDDKINNTFSVRQGADDKYYYVLGYEHKPLVTIDEWLANNTPEKEGKISDNWYDQSKHPFEENKEQKPEEKPGETPEPGVTPTPSVPENHYHENDYANIGAGEGTKEDGKKEDSKEESKENGKKEDSKEESKENGKEEKTGKEEKPEKPDMPAKPEKLGKENTDSPNKKKDKAELPKAGSEAEILTLAAASLSSVAGAFISLKKRK